jgi:hypothetical protein
MRPNLQALSAWGIALAFLLTVGVARLISYLSPGMHFNVGGVHIHHYVYGIFILTIAGYLALVFDGSRARSWIALLYGCGVGLTFDEFGFWVNPIFQRGVRWNNRGITLVIVGLVIVSLIPLMRRRPADAASAIGSLPDPVAAPNSDWAISNSESERM